MDYEQLEDLMRWRKEYKKETQDIEIKRSIALSLLEDELHNLERLSRGRDPFALIHESVLNGLALIDQLIDLFKKG